MMRLSKYNGAVGSCCKVRDENLEAVVCHSKFRDGKLQLSLACAPAWMQSIRN